MLLHMIKQTYQCEICNECFKRQPLLKKHLKRHKNETMRIKLNYNDNSKTVNTLRKKYQCTECFEEYLSLQLLKRHVVIHLNTTEKPLIVGKMLKEMGKKGSKLQEEKGFVKYHKISKEQPEIFQEQSIVGDKIEKIKKEKNLKINVNRKKMTGDKLMKRKEFLFKKSHDKEKKELRIQKCQLRKISGLIQEKITFRENGIKIIKWSNTSRKSIFRCWNCKANFKSKKNLYVHRMLHFKDD